MNHPRAILKRNLVLVSLLTLLFLIFNSYFAVLAINGVVPKEVSNNLQIADNQPPGEGEWVTVFESWVNFSKFRDKMYETTVVAPFQDTQLLVNLNSTYVSSGIPCSIQFHIEMFPTEEDLIPWSNVSTFNEIIILPKMGYWDIFLRDSDEGDEKLVALILEVFSPFIPEDFSNETITTDIEVESGSHTLLGFLWKIGERYQLNIQVTAGGPVDIILMTKSDYKNYVSPYGGVYRKSFGPNQFYNPNYSFQTIDFEKNTFSYRKTFLVDESLEIYIVIENAYYSFYGASPTPWPLGDKISLHVSITNVSSVYLFGNIILWFALFLGIGAIIYTISRRKGFIFPMSESPLYSTLQTTRLFMVLDLFSVVSVISLLLGFILPIFESKGPGVVFSILNVSESQLIDNFLLFYGSIAFMIITTCVFLEIYVEKRLGIKYGLFWSRTSVFTGICIFAIINNFIFLFLSSGYELGIGGIILEVTNFFSMGMTGGIILGCSRGIISGTPIHVILAEYKESLLNVLSSVLNVTTFSSILIISVGIFLDFIFPAYGRYIGFTHVAMFIAVFFAVNPFHSVFGFEKAQISLRERFWQIVPLLRTIIPVICILLFFVGFRRDTNLVQTSLNDLITMLFSVKVFPFILVFFITSNFMTRVWMRSSHATNEKAFFLSYRLSTIFYYIFILLIDIVLQLLLAEIGNFSFSEELFIVPLCIQILSVINLLFLIWLIAHIFYCFFAWNRGTFGAEFHTNVTKAMNYGIIFLIIALTLQYAITTNFFGIFSGLSLILVADVVLIFGSLWIMSSTAWSRLKTKSSHEEPFFHKDLAFKSSFFSCFIIISILLRTVYILGGIGSNTYFSFLSVISFLGIFIGLFFPVQYLFNTYHHLFFLKRAKNSFSHRFNSTISSILSLSFDSTSANNDEKKTRDITDRDPQEFNSLKEEIVEYYTSWSIYGYINAWITLHVVMMILFVIFSEALIGPTVDSFLEAFKIRSIEIDPILVFLSEIIVLLAIFFGRRQERVVGVQYPVIVDFGEGTRLLKFLMSDQERNSRSQSLKLIISKCLHIFFFLFMFVNVLVFFRTSLLCIWQLTLENTSFFSFIDLLESFFACLLFVSGVIIVKRLVAVFIDNEYAEEGDKQINYSPLLFLLSIFVSIGFFIQLNKTIFAVIFPFEVTLLFLSVLIIGILILEQIVVIEKSISLRDKIFYFIIMGVFLLPVQLSSQISQGIPPTIRILIDSVFIDVTRLFFGSLIFVSIFIAFYLVMSLITDRIDTKALKNASQVGGEALYVHILSIFNWQVPMEYGKKIRQALGIV